MTASDQPALTRYRADQPGLDPFFITLCARHAEAVQAPPVSTPLTPTEDTPLAACARCYEEWVERRFPEYRGWPVALMLVGMHAGSLIRAGASPFTGVAQLDQLITQLSADFWERDGGAPARRAAFALLEAPLTPVDPSDVVGVTVELLEWKRGEGRLAMAGEAWRRFAELLLTWYQAEAGFHGIIEQSLYAPSTGKVLITAQRHQGLTPMQLRTQAEHEVARAIAGLRALDTDAAAALARSLEDEQRKRYGGTLPPDLDPAPGVDE